MGPRSMRWVTALAVSIATALVFASLRAERGFVELGCAEGLVARAGRCCARGPTERPCTSAAACPAPLEPRDGRCSALGVAPFVAPEATITVGPSDWEAQGRVEARTLHVRPFAIDRVEATLGDVFCDACPIPDAARRSLGDDARAATHLTLDEARLVCRARGGRLPTEDEWIALAAGPPPSRRYPWGDTGAVCRRAVWARVSGACAVAAPGPDTVASHPASATDSAVFDLAGNVAEWVESARTASGHGVVKGGSFRSDLAAELRAWHRSERDGAARHDDVGVRCAYDVPLR